MGIKKPPLKRDGLCSAVPPSFPMRIRDLASNATLGSRAPYNGYGDPVTGESVRAYGKETSAPLLGEDIVRASAVGSQRIADSLVTEGTGQRVPVMECNTCYTLPARRSQYRT